MKKYKINSKEEDQQFFFFFWWECEMNKDEDISQKYKR